MKKLRYFLSSLFTLLFLFGMILPVQARAIPPTVNLAQRGPLFRPAGSPPSAQTSTGYTWSPLGAGIDSDVDAIAFSDNGEVYAAGAFTRAGTCTSTDGCNHIAKWDPATDTWSAMGSGTNDEVYALAVSGNTLYAGGKFTSAGTCTSGCYHIAKWDISTDTWSDLDKGVGVDDAEYVHAIAISGSSVYVGGDFDNVVGTCYGASEFGGCQHIAEWNTSTEKWSTLGTPEGTGLSDASSSVHAIAVSGSSVYVGGVLEESGLCGSENFEDVIILKWDGSIWSGLGCSKAAFGKGFWVDALAVSASGDVYAGGRFTQAGNCTSGCSNIAKWNGLTWSPLGTGTNDDTYAIAVNASGDVYAGGFFTSAGTCTTGCTNIAKWDGSTWSDLETGMNGPGDNSVKAIAINASNLYAGGPFIGAGTCTYLYGCTHIAKYALSSNLYPLYLPMVVR